MAMHDLEQMSENEYKNYLLALDEEEPDLSEETPESETEEN